MDTFPQAPAWRHEQSRSQSVAPRVLRKGDYLIGISLLLVVVFLWTSSNFITQDLFEEGYEKPFFVTYLNTGSFVIYLVPFFIRRTLDRRRSSTAEEYQPLINDPETLEESYEEREQPSCKASDSDELPPLTVNETMKLAFMFCFLRFIGSWLVNASLGLTSVASTTIFSSLSGFFTLIIGRIFRVERLTIGKIGAVVMSFAGSILVATSDSRSALRPNANPPVNSLAAAEGLGNHAPRPLLGDSFALASAIFYALYVILLKVRIRDEARVDMQLFFGFVGLINILCCWPMGFFLHFIDVEKFELPTTRQVVFAILLNMGLTLSSDFIYVLAMLKTTPLVVTIGLSLTIPLAVVGDFVLGRPARAQVLFGAALVLISFVVVGIQSSETKVDDSDLLDRLEPALDGREEQSLAG